LAPAAAEAKEETVIEEKPKKAPAAKKAPAKKATPKEE
jgi:hypothetical protein